MTTTATSPAQAETTSADVHLIIPDEEDQVIIQFEQDLPVDLGHVRARNVVKSQVNSVVSNYLNRPLSRFSTRIVSFTSLPSSDRRRADAGSEARLYVLEDNSVVPGAIVRAALENLSDIEAQNRFSSEIQSVSLVETGDSTTSRSTDDDDDDTFDFDNEWFIVSIVLASILLLICLAAFCYWCRVCQRRRKTIQVESMTSIASHGGGSRRFGSPSARVVPTEPYIIDSIYAPDGSHRPRFATLPDRVAWSSEEGKPVYVLEEFPEDGRKISMRDELDGTIRSFDEVDV
eukprot:m.61985 g.61985  ORF g.61985 m.61985 type:complete len:289 (-) comp7377_c1_seq1:45-911(-)